VVDLSRGTTIEQSGARINTVEHTLAALVGLELDNVLIQLDGPEPPIMDGSSIKFIEVLESAGMEEQNALRNYYEITEEIRYRDKERNVEIAALPLNDYRLTVMVDYNSPVLGSQHASITDIKQFPREIAACRTFCFPARTGNAPQAEPGEGRRPQQCHRDRGPRDPRRRTRLPGGAVQPAEGGSEERGHPQQRGTAL
jgi:UDP-3-O-acyl-N-acetylglucosamine deacetylase